MRYHLKGFTLIEAMIVLLVAAILLAVAIPAWSNASSAAHNGATRGVLAATVMEAVGHSALTGVEVVLCPDTGAAQCSGQVDWSGGWIVFADLNGNRVRDAAETVVKRAPKLEGGVRLRSTVGEGRETPRPPPVIRVRLHRLAALSGLRFAQARDPAARRKSTPLAPVTPMKCQTSPPTPVRRCRSLRGRCRGRPLRTRGALRAGRRPAAGDRSA